jgi:site-specific DNA recombinase
VAKPADEWVAVTIPAIVSAEAFAPVQEKLSHNQQTAARNTKHAYLLSGQLSCGACRLTCGMRMANGRRSYACRGRVDKRRRGEEGPCRARYSLPINSTI